MQTFSRSRQVMVGILHDLEGILELGEPLPCRPGKSPSKRYHRTRETDHLCAWLWSKPHECFGCFVNLMHGQSLTIKNGASADDRKWNERSYPGQFVLLPRHQFRSRASGDSNLAPHDPLASYSRGAVPRVPWIVGDAPGFGSSASRRVARRCRIAPISTVCEAMISSAKRRVSGSLP